MHACAVVLYGVTRLGTKEACFDQATGGGRTLTFHMTDEWQFEDIASWLRGLTGVSQFAGAVGVLVQRHARSLLLLGTRCIFTVRPCTVVSFWVEMAGPSHQVCVNHQQPSTSS